MAHTKAQGSSSNGRDSHGQRLGTKRYGGELVKSGMVIVRQRGTKILPGLNVGLGKDHTLFAKIEGVVTFEWAKKMGIEVSDRGLIGPTRRSPR